MIFVVCSALLCRPWLPPNLVPAREVVAVKHKADMGHGVTIELIAVNRDPSFLGETNLFWTADGRRREPVEHWYPGNSEGWGTRYLSFRVTAEIGGDVNLYSYCEGQHRWKAVDSRDYLMSGVPILYVNGVLRESKAVPDCHVGVALGEWHLVANVTWGGTHPCVIGGGPWGTLKLLPRAMPGASFRLRMPRATFQVDSPVLPLQSVYRITLFDRRGNRIKSANDEVTKGNQQDILLDRLPDVARVQIESRPLAFAIFRGIHFDPRRR